MMMMMMMTMMMMTMITLTTFDYRIDYGFTFDSKLT